MTIKSHDEQGEGITPDMLEEMERYGITRFPVHYFQLGQYKYTNLKDAVAQARRERSEE